MKKLFMFLAVTGLATFGVSCGSDDGGNGGGDNQPQTGLVLELVTDPADIFAGQGFELSIEDAAGNPIDGAVLNVDGDETTILSEDGVFAIQGPAGEIVLTATYDGVTSNAVTVVVQEVPVIPSEGEGTFTFNGQTYEIENSTVYFNGLAWADESQTAVVSQFQIESVSGTRTAIVMFTTPATPAAEEGYYNIALPTPTNTTANVAGVLNGQAVEGQTNTGVTLNFAAVMNETSGMFEGIYNAGATINSNPFTLSFDGSTPYVDVSPRPAAKGGSKVLTSGTKVKASNLSVISKEISKM